ANHLIVQYDHAVARDRAHRELFMAGKAELADKKYVERYTERTGNFVRNWHSAARKRTHTNVRTSGVLVQHCGKPASGVGAVVKRGRHVTAFPCDGWGRRRCDAAPLRRPDVRCAARPRGSAPPPCSVPLRCAQ